MNELKDMTMMGIEGETYKKLLDIAKKENKSVTEVAAEAIGKHIEDRSQVTESREKKLLMEG
jgi:predicted CopG family antitoxin